MSTGFAYLDILFFAMIAAFVLYRLGTVLGRRTGHERRRPTRFDEPAQAGDAALAAEAERGEAPALDAPSAAEPANADVRAGLISLRLADPSFDLGHFLEGAKTAFGMIIEAFAKGDKETLRGLLADEVYRAFEQAIDQRAAKGHQLTTEVVAIREAEVVDIKLVGTVARITVRFVSEQLSALRDAQGHLLEGNPSKVEEVVDVWTFERDVRARDPNWVLVETRAPE